MKLLLLLLLLLSACAPAHPERPSAPRSAESLSSWQRATEAYIGREIRAAVPCEMVHEPGCVPPCRCEVRVLPVAKR